MKMPQPLRPQLGAQGGMMDEMKHATRIKTLFFQSVAGDVICKIHIDK